MTRGRARRAPLKAFSIAPAELRENGADVEAIEERAFRREDL